jgi:hypothetical protein
MMFSHSPMIVLHPRYMDELKSHPDLDFNEANKKVRVLKLPIWKVC